MANTHWQIGLTVDDTSLHADRIKLWDEFNWAWLALGQRQLDLMESYQEDATTLQQKPLSLKRVKKLGDELLSLCNSIERHGLLDYQYGVQEEQILDRKEPLSLPL